MFYLGMTTREHPTWRTGHREYPGRLEHAVAETPPRASRTGGTVRALCGARVFDRRPTLWRGGADRACPKCQRVTRDQVPVSLHVRAGHDLEPYER